MDDCWASTPISTKISRRPGLASIAWLYHQSQRPNKTTRELRAPHPCPAQLRLGVRTTHTAQVLYSWAGQADGPDSDTPPERSSRGYAQAGRAAGTQPGVKHAILSRNPPPPPSSAQILPSLESPHIHLQSKTLSALDRPLFHKCPKPFCPILPWGYSSASQEALGFSGGCPGHLDTLQHTHRRGAPTVRF